MADAGPIDRDLALLETELKRLESEYNMFFAGRLPRPPWETRARVQAIVKRLDRLPLTNYGDKFRFNTLQSRYATFVDLWDRGLRAREEGRSGPFAVTKPQEVPAPPRVDRTLRVTTFSDPLHEMEKLRELHRSLSEARREAGQDAVPFRRFADLVATQVSQLRGQGSGEVAFRVAVKEGKVSFTARVMKGDPT